MKTKIYNFYSSDGKEVPIIVPSDAVFPSYKIEYYDEMSCCGAGSGVGDKMVPESIFFLRVTLACYVHDKMWELAEASWTDFHHSNSVFLRNINSIICKLSYSDGINFLKSLRMYRAVTFFNSVDTIGASVFWKLKKDQGMM